VTVPRIFAASAELQDFLLQEGPGAFIVVPHQRLAHQVWHRQRQRQREAGHTAWEPLTMATLGAWWRDLFASLWPPVIPASRLRRLALWRQALRDAPPLTDLTSGLEWAQALDEAYALLSRHRLPLLEPGRGDPPVVAWRRRLTRIFLDRLRQEQMLAEAELPAYLLRALAAGKTKLPPQILLVGFQSPAPLEATWLEAVAARTRVVRLQVKGSPQAIKQAVALPDPRQELEWAAAKLVELAAEGAPLHRLAVTSMAMDTYAPQWRRILAEILGPPQTGGKWAYNFSRGPVLAETSLFKAALLPLTFAALGERREDLVSLLLSPYYGLSRADSGELPLWDRRLREQRLDRGWEQLKKIAASPRGMEKVLSRLDRAWAPLRAASARSRDWAGALTAAWRTLGFPQGLDEAETSQWQALTSLMDELDAALAAETLNAGEFLEWLSLGAGQVLLAGPGVQEAGIQVMGLLEMRGLDFDRVLCLGLNSGTFPEPPRPLPLLNAAEKRQVLGGTFQSQHQFARELFDTFLGTAPDIILTRPRLVDQEEQVATPLYLGDWTTEAEMAPLSRPHPAWLRVPAVQAAFAGPRQPAPEEEQPPVAISLPDQLAITRAQTALSCPCRFLLEVLLEIEDLPEIEAGLDPRDRGAMLHQLLARFTTEFQAVLDRDGAWDPLKAREQLQAAARQLLQKLLPDLHWQAEWERWLGEGDSGGLLWEWLQKEQQRFAEGWRWLGMEVKFQDLTGQDWPFALKGRIDRLDYHPGEQCLVIWDYKSGEVPGPKKVFDELAEFQLPGYLLALQGKRVAVAKEVAEVRAGFIGLKSSREKHLKHEDFAAREQDWDRVTAAWEERLAALGRRLAAGDFGPEPAPAPAGKDRGACRYCPYLLVCGFTLEPAAEADEEE
jgi:RecB family exonuclease